MIEPATIKLLTEYAGDDRVIDSFEMRDWLRDQPTSKKVFSGFTKIDRFLDGFEQGELIAISGPRKSGKTLWCQSMTCKINEDDVKPLWFSYEVTPENFFKTFNTVGLPYFVLPRTLRQGSLLWIEERICEALVKFGSPVVFIDHLHFILDLEKVKNTSIEIGSLIRSLKMIALKYRIIIFLICHMRKIPKDEEPSDLDMRDSSFIAQESDTGIIIFRTKNELKSNESWLKICYSRRTGVFDEKIKLHKQDGILVESDPHEEQQPIDGKLRATGDSF